MEDVNDLIAELEQFEEAAAAAAALLAAASRRDKLTPALATGVSDYLHGFLPNSNTPGDLPLILLDQLPSTPADEFAATIREYWEHALGSLRRRIDEAETVAWEREQHYLNTAAPQVL